MDPIKFTDDFHKFVLQDQKLSQPPLQPPLKPFDINLGKTKKTKKDTEKDKKDKKRK